MENYTRARLASLIEIFWLRTWTRRTHGRPRLEIFDVFTPKNYCYT